MSDEENVARRRSRRSTAGNRMQAALAEITVEDANNDMEEDGDFVNDKDEVDVFESDFESTDDEAAQTETILGEKEVLDQEKRARNQAKSRLEKVTAVADARLRVTFNPDAISKEAALEKVKEKRRCLHGSVLSVTTDATEAATPTSTQRKIRQSQRKYTMQNRVESVKRMKSSEAKKATIPKKAKVVKKLFSQGQLLQGALDNEEGNIVEHRDYLRLEEEKRQRAKVIKTSVEGPCVRWVSRLEQVEVTSQPPLSPPLPRTTCVPHIGMSTYQASGYPCSHAHTPYSGQSSQVTDTKAIQALQAPINPSPSVHSTISATAPESNPTAAVNASVGMGEIQPQQIVKSETVTKNYVIHEQGQHDGIRKPSWIETMRALFGDHVAWDEVRVYVGKGRPLSRPKHICSITGRPAVYLDPRTGVPYADVNAFKVLTGLLEHEYIWDAELGCYVGQADVT